ncbi:YlaC family protein [Morganella psychrotolerans]|uniref:Inner membrane protein ylaC n=1 Tax=Morganella psychrotolerans TaxID=368603 RepID=A0A5M9RBF0_9GAMM|nr:YlaC family protein [Morganella psychrotolerans]KAA8717552.1 hypothetical protein F4V73_06835 [Morganella psychrotolerans]OBU09199.1 hypothetical protein AYY16_02190 [Morganella psychrotolerans]
MDIVKSLITSALDTINQREKRDGKPRFNSHFLRTYPFLCLAMVVSYLFLGVLIYYAPYFGFYWLLGFSALFLVMAAVLLFEIKPVYHFADIGVLDLRVCYNGEWFVSEIVPPETINALLSHPQVSDSLKQDIRRTNETKNDLSFYDLFLIAYPEKHPEKQASHWMKGAA